MSPRFLSFLSVTLAPSFNFSVFPTSASGCLSTTKWLVFNSHTSQGISFWFSWFCHLNDHWHTVTATIWRFTKGAEKELFLIRYLNSCVTSLASVGFHISEDTRKEKLLFASFRVLQDSHGLRTKQEKGMIFSVGPFITESLESFELDDISSQTVSRATITYNKCTENKQKIYSLQISVEPSSKC